MEYRQLGASGLKVSPLCIGTMLFGDRTDADEARRIIDSGLDAGINFIDTADVYANGESERVTGKLIAEKRSRWILATKVGNAIGADPNDRGLSRRWIMRACEASLARLATDYLDIYYAHLDFPDTPLHETVGAFGDLIRAGKIRYFGISNYRGWRIAQVIQTCQELGVPPPVVCQPYYNAMNRTPEVEILPACEHFGIGVVPYSPVARGVLTGKYQPGAAPATETRAGRGDKRLMQTEFREESMRMAQEIKAHATERGMTAVQFAVNWVLNNKTVNSVIAGPRTLEQWTEYLGSLEHRFTPADEALVNRLVTPGHPSTPGYNDPQYPLTGRNARVA
jgi:aryl-alcohol dehydrogenase-like predicted oxidoreductase